MSSGASHGEEDVLERARAEASAAQDRLAALERGTGPRAPDSGEEAAPVDARSVPAGDEGGDGPVAAAEAPGDVAGHAAGPSGGRWLLIAGIAAAAVLGVWRTGTFDHALVDWGLNAKGCARNGFGAVYCGDELTEQRGRELEADQQRRIDAVDSFTQQSDAWRSCVKSMGPSESYGTCGPAPEPPAITGP